MEKEKLDETLKLRISKQEKARYENLATRAGLSTSALVRTVMSEEGRVVFLDEGRKIAEEFCNCNRLLAHFMAHGQLTDAERLRLEHHMEEITHQLSSVTQSLVSIDIEGEDDE